MASDTEQLSKTNGRPDTSASPEQVAAAVRLVLAQVASDRSRLMDVVQAVQYRLGYIPDAAVRLVAEALGIQPVEVEDMVSFYAYLDRKPKGRFHIRLSKTPVSLMKGAAEVAKAFEAAMGIALGTTSADGAFSLEWTADIGMGDQKPAALINGTVVTAVTPADATAISAALRGSRLSETLPLFPGSGVDGLELPCA
ncbi:MAG: NAD(P)H-dependent oxidoreductase subunit E, partial [Acetobacteraceae bacterium]|nr:NAD(P)H-dependent oxidoreductase subunit E [Acetobacteraceae bacterium]